MATYPVYIVQYTRDPDYRLPFHWEIAVKIRDDRANGRTKPLGVVYHLHGSTNGFIMQRKDNVHYESPLNWAGSLPICTIPADRIAQVETLLSQVEIQMTKEWNCQNWVQLGMRKMYMHGYPVGRDIAESFQALQRKMWELFQRWNAGEA